MSLRFTARFALLSAMLFCNPSFAATPRSSSSSPGISILDFGATPNDLFDDTKAIQSAIDSLPRASQLDVAAVSGGVIHIPKGIFRVSSLRVPSNVTLRGEGAGSVVVGEGNAATIVISAGTNQQALGVSLDSLTIISAKNSAIAVDANTKLNGGDIFERLFLKAHLTAIDLHGTYSQNVVIRDSIVWNGGGAALWLEGNANEINRFNCERSDDADFKLGDGIQARVNVVGNGNTIAGCIIEGGTKSAPAFYCKGLISWTNNWVETFQKPGDIAYLFDQCNGQIDNLHLLDPNHKAKFINSHGLQIRELDMSAEEDAPTSCVIVDDDCSVTVDEVISRFDCGGLDDSRLRIKSYYNATGKYRIENPPIAKSANLLLDAEMTTAARKDAEGQAGWRAWSDGNAAEFTLTPETIDGKRSLRIDITKAGDRNVDVAARMNVPPELIGKRAIVQIQLDGPSHMLAWSNGFGGQYAIRHWGQRAMAMSPVPLVKDEEIIFAIDGRVPGTYRITGLTVTAAP